MKMQSKRNLMIATVSMIVSILSLHFTSCSEVNFKDATGNGSAGSPVNPRGCDPNTGLCVPCETYECDEDNLKKVNQDITVSGVSSKVDILLMVDDSGSMAAEHKEFGSRLNGFVKGLEDANIDWQICYTISHVDINNKAGRILPWDGNGRTVLKSGDSNTESIFFSTMEDVHKNNNRPGAGNEQGIHASRLAFTDPGNSSCFRDGAGLALIIISDEDEMSCGGRCEFHNGSEFRPASDYRKQYRKMESKNAPQGLVDAVSARFPGKPFTAHSIVIRENDTTCHREQDRQAPAFYGLFYSELSRKTGGTIGDICAVSYANQLNIIGNRIEDSLKSVTLECAPVKTPKVSGSIGSSTMTVQGNKLIFNPGLPPGTQFSVEYFCIDE